MPTPRKTAKPVTASAPPKKTNAKKTNAKKSPASRTMAPGTSVDAYIAGFPPEVQARLEQMRQAIAKLVPQATETISYGIPTFKLHGNLVHYAGYANHVGFYPGGAGIAAFQEEIAGYKSAKGSVQFPHSKPLPLALVKKIVKYRVAQNEAKSADKAQGKPRRK